MCARERFALFFFFFSSRRRHTRWTGDWSSDVCSSDLPKALRDLLLQRVARLDHPAQNVLRLAAAAGREVGYPLLRATVELPDGALRDSLRAAVVGGVLAAEPETGSFRFRHALLAEAIYATILPGEREELHARLAEELARSGAAGAAELAPHWAVAGRTAEALVASVEAACQAEAVFGLAEALAHVERALMLWETVPNPEELVQADLAELCSLVARGYTNREIAATLVISVKTASVHVSHILRKLGAPNRLEAAAIAHRLAPPPAGQPEPSASDRPGL